jgi:tRNA U55 pseudouridine synthase TruB
VCEGGTYVRKLIVDIASDLGSCATTIALQRIAQGPFTLTDCLYEEQWSLDNIKSAIERYAAAFKQNKNENTH